MSELHWMGAGALAQAYAGRTLSPVEVVTALLARIERLNPRLGAFIRVDGEAALAAARSAEAELAGGRVRGPLHGVPVGVKQVGEVRDTFL